MVETKKRKNRPSGLIYKPRKQQIFKKNCIKTDKKVKGLKITYGNFILTF